jgi:hypothetical protein
MSILIFIGVNAFVFIAVAYIINPLAFKHWQMLGNRRLWQFKATP